MPTIKINDIDLYYETTGEGEPLVLIGGLTADHNVWKSTARVFSKHFQVIMFDNRGAGQSSAPDTLYTTAQMAEDTIALMDALSIPKAHILGHSMGGCIAQQIAINHPHRINKLIIACSRAYPSRLANMVLAFRTKLIEQNADELLLTEYMIPFLFSEQFIQNMTNIKGFIHWTVNNPHPQSAVGFKQQVHAVTTHDVFDQAPQITAPTLVIAGDEDCLMPAKQGRELSEVIPGARFEVIPQSAHMPHVEQSKLFCDVVMSFLSN